MRYPKWFARWRLRVWDNRLHDWRKEWLHAIDASDEHQHPEAFAAVTVDQYYERLVTRGMAKRVKWRKRLGILKRAQ